MVTPLQTTNIPRRSRCANYVIFGTLGSGSFGIVKCAIHSQTRQVVALKILKPERPLKEFQKEIEILAQLDHKHITKLIAVLSDESYHKKNGEEFIRNVIVMELASKGHLFGFLKASAKVNGAGFSDAVARTFFHQMVEAIDYCHSRKIVHRDLKPENILLDADYDIKIADFGWATILDNIKHITRAGTQVYEPPETKNFKGYDLAPVDIFTLGVILFMMKAALRPFNEAVSGDNYYKHIYQGRPQDFWALHSNLQSTADFFSDDFKELVTGMITADPKKRYTIEDVKASAWYKGKLAEKAEIVEEFSRLKDAMKAVYRNEAIERKEAREKARKKAMLEQFVQTDYKTYRGSEDVTASIDMKLADLAVEIESGTRTIKINPEKKNAENAFAFYIDLMFLFKCLVYVVSLNAVDYEISETAYQVKGVFSPNSDCPEVVKIMMKIYQIELEGEYVVEFEKLEGDYWDFLELVHGLIMTELTKLTK